MRTLQWTAFTLFLVMTAGLTYGLTVGEFWEEGGQITDLIWGNLTLLDFYIGVAFICMWIAFREVSWIRSLVWILFVIGLGNWTVSLYVFLAARSSEGNWKRFFFGNRAI